MHAEMPDIPRSAPELNFAPQFVDLIPINISEPCNFDAGTFAEESSGCCRQQLSPNYEERSSPPWWNTALSNSQPVDPSPVPSAHPSDESAHTPGAGVMRRSFEDSEPTFALQPSSPACMASAVDEMMRCRVQQFAETNQQCDARHGVHGPKSVCAFPVLSKGQEQTLSHAQTSEFPIPISSRRSTARAPLVLRETYIQNPRSLVMVGSGQHSVSRIPSARGLRPGKFYSLQILMSPTRSTAPPPAGAAKAEADVATASADARASLTMAATATTWRPTRPLRGPSEECGRCEHETLTARCEVLIKIM